jgi:hypothetical protein
MARRRADSDAVKPNFAARLPDATITVAAPYKTAYFGGSHCVLVFR